MRAHGLGYRPGLGPGGLPHRSWWRRARSCSTGGWPGLGRTLDALVAKAKLDAAGKKQILDRIAGATDFAALKDCDLVIEAITENQPLKNETFARLDADLPAARPARLEHLVLQRDRDGGGDQAAGHRCWGCTSSTRCRS